MPKKRKKQTKRTKKKERDDAMQAITSCKNKTKFQSSPSDSNQPFPPQNIFLPLAIRKTIQIHSIRQPTQQPLVEGSINIVKSTPQGNILRVSRNFSNKRSIKKPPQPKISNILTAIKSLTSRRKTPKRRKRRKRKTPKRKTAKKKRRRKKRKTAKHEKIVDENVFS
tara:strand:- start:959 stop:1459 length:501 start_codon:yes stop_codon:yes gene_type:complete